jgi:hypothetical protein
LKKIKKGSIYITGWTGDFFLKNMHSNLQILKKTFFAEGLIISSSAPGVVAEGKSWMIETKVRRNSPVFQVWSIFSEGSSVVKQQVLGSLHNLVVLIQKNNKAHN